VVILGNFNLEMSFDGVGHEPELERPNL
jgi:hypothetical protein